MRTISTARVTSKGQITIPHRIRKLLDISSGSSVAFRITEEGVLMLPCEFEFKSPYTADEWRKIKKLAEEEGEVYKSAKKAKEYINKL